MQAGHFNMKEQHSNKNESVTERQVAYWLKEKSILNGDNN